MIPPLSEALAERGYDQLTPVQEAVTAPDIDGADLLVSAQTGSGKTVGFGLAIAPTLLGDDITFGPAATPLGLVVAPTRELAFQVMRELTWLYARTGAVVASCVGGMDMRTERRALERGAHIVVGTPGRLRDHIERDSLDLSALRAVVLDEADEMLDMGFREDLEFMLAAAPEERRTLLFSATVPPVIAKLAQQYQRDAMRINTIGAREQHADISYQAVRVADRDADNAVFNLLRYHDEQAAIVFANTRATVAHLTARLSNRGLSVVSLSGELSQTERTHALQAMRDGRARVCVATDVAARGIDLPNLNLVIHAELPTNAETLLHRSGRTGRAGRKGISAMIVPPKARRRAENLLKWGKLSAEWVTAPSVEDVLRRDEERLLSDPAWAEPVSEEQAAFAEKLLAQYSAEQVAAAYLRLFQSRHAAPEDLLPADTKPEKREPRAFGPSRWVALSVGRAERAEPRWLLPLLCRAGNLDKSAIGAIRVQENESFVELAEAALDGFLRALGADAVLEDGVRVSVLDNAPEIAPSSRPPRESRPERAAPKPRKDWGDKPARKPRDDARTKPAPKPRADGADVARKPRHKAPQAAPREWHPEDAPQTRPRSDKPRAAAKAKPDYRDPVRKADQSDAPRPKSFKPKDKGFGKAIEKAAKPFGKPKGKPAPKADARDTSKRFVPPGKAGGKPAGKPRKGGFDTPRRKP